jgi:protein-tyrosine phosphatase
MIPLVDMHCHLLAGMDDGPRTPEDALAMCKMAYGEGVRMACATAHQNDHWKAVTPDGIRAGTAQLAQRLREAGVPLTVFPCAEVMVHVDLTTAWHAGQVLSVADRKMYLLMEMPHGLFVDLRHTVQMLRELGLRPILAHPEQQPELLEEPGQIEQLIQAGCLVQVSTKNITDPKTRLDGRRLRDWFKRGIVHVLGTDGHSPRRRRPLMAEAYKQVVRWVGNTAADRICSTNGMAILQGLPLRIPEPVVAARRWFSRFW